MGQSKIAWAVLAVAGAAGIAWLSSEPDDVGGRVVLSAATQKFKDSGVAPPLEGQTNVHVRVNLIPSTVQPTLQNPCDAKHVRSNIDGIKIALNNSISGQSPFDRFLAEVEALRGIIRLQSADLTKCFSSGSEDKRKLTAAVRSNAILAMRERIDVLRALGSLQDRFQASEDMDRILFLVKMTGQNNFSEKDLLWELGYNKTSDPQAEYEQERRDVLMNISDAAIGQMKQKYGFHPREMILLNLGETVKKGDDVSDLVQAHRYLARAIHNGVPATDERRSLQWQLQRLFYPSVDQSSTIENKQ